MRAYINVHRIYSTLCTTVSRMLLYVGLEQLRYLSLSLSLFSLIFLHKDFDFHIYYPTELDRGPGSGLLGVPEDQRGVCV